MKAPAKRRARGVISGGSGARSGSGCAAAAQAAAQPGDQALPVDEHHHQRQDLVVGQVHHQVEEEGLDQEEQAAQGAQERPSDQEAGRDRRRLGEHVGQRRGLPGQLVVDQVVGERRALVPRQSNWARMWWRKLSDSAQWSRPG
jgi:hypothetical protein